MFELNATLLIFAFFFLVFTYLLNEIVLKPVGATLERRKAIIQENYDSARSYSGEGDAVVSQYMEHMQETRTQAQKIIHDSVVSAQKKRDDELQRVRAQGNSKLDQVKAELSGEKSSLIESLVEPELQLVKDIAAKLLGDAPAMALDQGVVRQALEEAK